MSAAKERPDRLARRKGGPDVGKRVLKLAIGASRPGTKGAQSRKGLCRRRPDHFQSVEASKFTFKQIRWQKVHSMQKIPFKTLRKFTECLRSPCLAWESSALAASGQITPITKAVTVNCAAVLRLQQRALAPAR
jgi:hypothetical protein